jgi:hypothetical protein
MDEDLNIGIVCQVSFNCRFLGVIWMRKYREINRDIGYLSTRSIEDPIETDT